MSSPDYSDGCMLALYPPPGLADHLTVPDGLAAHDLHVTVAYLGDASDVDQDTLLAVAKHLVERPPVAGAISGHARFTGGEQDVLVALIDSADLEDLRREVLDRLRVQGIGVPRDHGYTPHCTLTYLTPEEPVPTERIPAEPVEFTALSLVHGTDRTDFPFRERDPIEACVRQAFAAGWASSGGPMTDRVRAASVAAVALATEHADDPQILEVAVDLGRLEGMWATLFSRREKLIAQHTAIVNAAWSDLISPRMLRDGIYQLRAELGLTEADSDDDPEDDDAVNGAVMAAAVATLRSLPEQPGWGALLTALRDSLAAGRAEGAVAAVAIAAERAKRRGLNWDTAFGDAVQQLQRLDDLWSDAADWLGRLAARATQDLTRALTSTVRGTFTDMLNAAVDALTGAASTSVAFTVDWAMTTAAALGGQGIYQAATVISWTSVGDGRVCATCEYNEAGSPYTPGDLPAMPAHPKCRCTTSADIDLSRYAAWFTT